MKEQFFKQMHVYRHRLQTDVDFFVTEVKDYDLKGYWIHRKTRRVIAGFDEFKIPHSEHWTDVSHLY